jgi:PAS domain S-box-containing protein
MRRSTAAALATLIVIVASGIGTVLVTFTDIGVLRVTLIIGLASTVGILAYRTLRAPVVLEQRVRDRTQDLQSSLIEAWLQKRDLRAARDHLHAILTVNPDAVVGVGRDGRITEWNDAAERVYGFTRDEIIGQDLFLLIHGDRQPLYQRYAEELRAGRPVKGVIPARRKDGSVFDAEVHHAAVHDPEGLPRTVVGVVRDVTEERLLEHAGRAFRSSLDPGAATSAFVRAFAGQISFEAVALCLVDEERIHRTVCVDGKGRSSGSEQEVPHTESTVTRAIRSRSIIVTRHAGASTVLGPLDAPVVVAAPILGADEPIGALAFGFRDEPSRRVLGLLERAARSISQEVVHIMLYKRQQQITTKLRELDELKSVVTNWGD